MTLQASFDIDGNDHGVWTLATPVDCPTCDLCVLWTRGTMNRQLPDVVVLTCPNCLSELGEVEEL